MAGPYAFRTKEGEEIHNYLRETARRLKRGDVVVVILGSSTEDTTKFVEHLLPQDAHVTHTPSTGDRGIGNDGTPCTSYIQPFPSGRNLHCKSLDAKRLISVKTPGVNALGLSEAEVLEEFIQTASILRRGNPAFLSCIVSIVPLRIAPARDAVNIEHNSEACFPPLAASLLQAISGAPSCALVTTGWSTVAEDVGRSKEQELCRMLWGDELDGALAFRLSDDHPQRSVWGCVDGLIAKLAEESRHRPVLPAISVVRLTRWLSSIRAEQTKESGTEGTTPFVAPPPHTIKRPFRIGTRTLSSRYSSRPPSLYITPPTSPVEETFAINQPRPRRVSGLRTALHTNRLSGRLSLVEVATDGGSSWAEGDRVSSEGMSLKTRRSWVENFESSGKGSSSWDECDGDIQRLSLGSGDSWDDVEGVVGEDGEDEDEEGHEEEAIRDSFSEDNDCGPNNGDEDRLREVEELSEVTTEYSGETEWGERGGGNVVGYPSICQTGPGSTPRVPKVVIKQDILTTMPEIASDSPQPLRPGSNQGSSPSDLLPPPVLSSTPSSVTIALPAELFRVSHNGSLSSLTSFTSAAETESTAASSSNNGNGGGQNYFGGASHFGVKITRFTLVVIVGTWGWIEKAQAMSVRFPFVLRRSLGHMVDVVLISRTFLRIIRCEDKRNDHFV